MSGRIEMSLAHFMFRIKEASIVRKYLFHLTIVVE
jgi:hypothetical protein